MLANSSRVFQEPVAQHMLAFMLAWARQLPLTMAHQRGDRRWPKDKVRRRSFLLNGQSAVLVGYGSIAARLVALLAPFGMKLTGLRRRVRDDEAIAVLAMDDPRTDGVLAQADHVINLLPASPSTRRWFDGKRLAGLKRGAVFYNGGRGTKVDQDALVRCLDSEHLAAAFLDVADPEPLPPEHPLWTAPNCTITPHSAGGHHDEHERLLDHFLANLARFETREALEDRVY